MWTVRVLVVMGLLAAGAAPVLGAAPKAAADEEAMLRRLARVSGRVDTALRQQYPKFRKSGRRLSFGLAWDETLDAIAVPEGRVTITSGFMQALASRPDDELAAVLGHEATHIAERHRAYRGDEIMLGDLLSAARGEEQSGGRGGSTLEVVRHRLNDEYRADAASVKLLQAAGYDPGAMSSVLKMLKQCDEDGSAKAPAVVWFANHPDPDKRMESADRVAAEVRPAPLDSDGDAAAPPDQVEVVH